MPPLPNVPGVLRIEHLQSSSSDTDVRTRLYVEYTGGPPVVTDLTTMGADLVTAWTSHIKPLYTGDKSLTEITVTDLASTSGAQGVTTASVSGSRTGASIPASTCAQINYAIGRRYRGGKPRSYLQFGSDTDVSTTTQWSTTFQSAVNSGWAAYIAAIESQTFGSITTGSLVNVSYYHGFTAVLNPITGRYKNVPNLRTSPLVDTITAFEMPLIFSSQRRRNRA